MDLDNLSLALQTPRYLSPVSAWVEHIPFAFALIDLLRPRTLVELGTHMGDSFCAFCQAIDALALDTQCTAIDTWTGDSQAGDYGTAILTSLRAYHDPLYARFSRLLPSTFDAAAPSFPDHSIDLLHIDGLHTYDAVKHDFSTWLPKLSPRGVILFHDTHVRRDDFGVFTLWEELAPRYPSFAFTHGYGLGVLAVGTDIPAPFTQFLTWANRQPATAQAFFEALGRRIRLARGFSTLHDSLSASRGALLPAADAKTLDREIPVVPPATPADLLASTLDPKQWVDQLDASVRRQTTLLGDIIDQGSLRNARASLCLYVPNPQGAFDEQHMHIHYAHLHPRTQTAIFRIELPPSRSPHAEERKLRLDPGDRPAIWSLLALRARILDRGQFRPLRLPISMLTPGPGAFLLGARARLDTASPHPYVLFCHTRDPQLELRLGSVLPAGQVTLELSLDFRIWDSFGAYSDAAPQGAPTVEALVAALSRADFR